MSGAKPLLQPVPDVELDDDLEDEEIPDLEDLFNKNTLSFRCLAQQLLSRSSLLRHPLYHFPPLEDPGINETFSYVEPPPIYDTTGIDHYLRLCREFDIVPISRIIRSLPTDILDLKYYGLTENQVRAFTIALQKNEHVLELHLQDNWMTTKAVKYIGNMLIANITLRFLNLRECRIKPEGAGLLVQALMSTVSLQHLDLSNNSLGDEGMMILEDGLCENNTLKILSLKNNDLGDDGAKVIATVLDYNPHLEELDLSWNNFYSGPGNKLLFNSLSMSKSIKKVNVAWNGMSTRDATVTIRKFLRAAPVLEHFDISHNRLSGSSLFPVRFGAMRCAKLKTLNVGCNLLTPDDALGMIRIFSSNRSLKELLMENTFVSKAFVPLARELINAGKVIEIGGVFSNFTIKGPVIEAVLFARAKFLGMDAKKKKQQKDFGHFILQLPDESMLREDFLALFNKFKASKIDAELIAQILDRFPAKKEKIDVVEMRNCYLALYPDTRPPAKKAKKGKKKGKKKEEESDATLTEGDETLTEGEQPSVEGQEPAEGQPVTTGEAGEHTEGEPKDEATEAPKDENAIDNQETVVLENQTPTTEAPIETPQES